MAAPGTPTTLSRALLFAALVPAVAGLALGNAPLLVIATAAVLVLVRAREPPTEHGQVSTHLDAGHVQKGATVQANLSVQVPDGPLFGLAHQRLPEPFQLVTGSNLHLVPPGARQPRAFTFASAKRGHWELDPPTLDLVHPLLLSGHDTAATGRPTELTVEPLIRPLRTVKGLRGIGRDKHGEDRATRGPASTEFQEIRDYVKGDPLKFVNWKATAKESTRDLRLMVNQFEPEARKNVWFFLDLDESLEVGTTLETALEDGIDIALALVHHFVGRGNRVGGCTFNGEHRVFYPDSGSRQELTIARTLAKVEPGHDHEGLPTAVERVKGFLARERPLVFVITRPEVDTDGLLEGVRRVHSHTATARRASPVTVLAPEPPTGDPVDALAQAIRGLEAKRQVQQGGTPYLHIHRLQEGARGLERALARGVLAR